MSAKALRLTAVLSAYTLCANADSAFAQAFDPRPALGQIIQAFQNCGPPPVYQMLSPQLFQIVAQQTGGSGCYAQIQQAGPITNMQVVSQQQYPVGPLFVVRVSHSSSITADWVIGFNQFTSKIEYLTFQAVPQNQPPVTIPAPSPGGPTGGGGPPPSPPSGTPSTPSGDGCDMFPAMCQ